LKYSSAIVVVHIVEMFNYISSHGFPHSCISNIIHPIYKSRNPLDPKNYIMIMVGNTLEKLFATTLDDFISIFVEMCNLHMVFQYGFCKNYCIVDHIIILQAIIEEACAYKWKVYYCFIEFCKAIDIVPRHLLFHKLENLGIPRDVISLVMKLYERIVG